jgi:hypothetical protein
MTNVDISANTKLETKRDLDLTLDELETVSGGGTRKSGGNTASGAMFLTFTFKLVAVKTISF